MSSSSPWPAINQFSNWNHLDSYLAELIALSGNSLPRPRYGQVTGIVIDGDRAEGTIPIRTTGGIIAGLNGNSVKNIDAGNVELFMKKISGKWLICHENEYNGELDSKQTMAPFVFYFIRITFLR